MSDPELRAFRDKYPHTTGVIRKITVDLSAIFVDKKITIAGWQTLLASSDFSVCSHLTYKIHSQHNASLPLLPFCSIEDKWIRYIYLSNDAAQAGVSVDLIIVHPPTKLNYTGIYSQTIDTEGSITAILNSILTINTAIEANTDTLESILGAGNLTTLLTAIQGYVDTLETALGAGDLTTLITALNTYVDGLEAVLATIDTAQDLTNTKLDSILTKNTEIDAVLDTLYTESLAQGVTLDNILLALQP